MTKQLWQAFKAHRAAWELFGLLMLGRALIARSKAARLQHANRAYSLLNTRFLREWAHRLVRPYLNHGDPTWMREQIGWARFSETLRKRPTMTRTVIVKKPGPNGEKGVLLTYFEYNFLRLLKGMEPFEVFDASWTVVFCTSWSPTDYNMVALALSRIQGPVYIQACNHAEIPRLQAYHPRVQPLDSLPCDWLEPSFYQPKPWEERSIDLLMISNWAPFKRHWEFFKALSRMPAHLRVVCVGQPQDGCDLEDIRKMKRELGAPQEIEFLESIPIERVTELACNSRVSVIFSLHEGCCVAAAESLMAGALLAIREDAHVGPKQYIHEGTGIRLRPGQAHIQLMEALNHPPKTSPSEWAVQQISNRSTLNKLQEQLKRDAIDQNLPWTTDLVLPCWRPYPRYVHPQDKEHMIPVYQELHQSHPETFCQELPDISHM